MTSRTDTEDKTYHSQDSFFAVISRKFDYARKNRAMYLQSEDDKVIEEIISFFSQRDKSFTLELSDEFGPKYSREYLEEYGFEYKLSYLRMVVNTEDLQLPDPEFSYKIRMLNTKERLKDDFLRIIYDSTPDQFPSLAFVREMISDRIHRDLKNPDTWTRVFAAFTQDGTPVGSASLRYSNSLSDFAELAGASVLPDYRRQGIYTQLTLHRVKNAVQNSLDNVYIDADLTTSAPIVETLGFAPVEKLTVYSFDLTD